MVSRTAASGRRRTLSSVATDLDAVQSALLAATVFGGVAGFLAVAGRYRDARLLGLLADDERRLERAAERVRELAEARDPDAFARAQLRLAEALATLVGDVPNCRRLLLLDPGRPETVASQARLALAEIADLALEAQIDRDVFTLGFAWARKRRREIARRIEVREPVAHEEQRAA